MTVLRTRRLVLRAKDASDADAMHEIASCWEVARRTATWPWPPDRGFTEARAAAPQPERGLVAMILFDGRSVGMASAVNDELGYMLHPWAWGQGFATEACAALLRHWFATNAPSLGAGVFEGNPASVSACWRSWAFEKWAGARSPAARSAAPWTERTSTSGARTGSAAPLSSGRPPRRRGP